MQFRPLRRPRAAVVRGAVVTAFALALTSAPVLAASLPSGGAATKRAATARPPARKAPARGPITLYHINHRESLRLRFADDRGRPIKGFQRQFDHFLRCHYTKKRHAMNPRLARLLFETGRHYPGRRIEVVSGYRHPRFAKNPRSPHMKGLAADVRVVGVKNTELRDFFRSRFRSVGVGYYPNSSFVHLDVRRGSSAFWIDYAGPGETAVYAKNALDDLRTGRADRWRRAVIDPSWADTDDETSVSGASAMPAPEAEPEEGAEADSDTAAEPGGPSD